MLVWVTPFVPPVLACIAVTEWAYGFCNSSLGGDVSGARLKIYLYSGDVIESQSYRSSRLEVKQYRQVS